MRLIYISAWNDSGGGFTHRLFDGHQELDVWPFELLLGADDVLPDRFEAGRFRGRYRWPRLGAYLKHEYGAELFNRIADSELKDVLAGGSKHAAFPVPVSIDEWRSEVVRRWSGAEKTQAAFLSIYVRTFFELWKPNAPHRSRVLGHCPVGVLDAPEVWRDFPDTQIVHVVRNPLSGFAGMRARHPDLDPNRYGENWSLINGWAAGWALKRPDLVRLVALDDLIGRRGETMRQLTAWLGLAEDDCLLAPSWDGRALDQSDMGPFGGVKDISAKREMELVAEAGEQSDVLGRETHVAGKLVAEALRVAK